MFQTPFIYLFLKIFSEADREEDTSSMLRQQR
jgi:hypothetical protein